MSYQNGALEPLEVWLQKHWYPTHPMRDGRDPCFIHPFSDLNHTLQLYYTWKYYVKIYEQDLNSFIQASGSAVCIGIKSQQSHRRFGSFKICCCVPLLGQPGKRWRRGGGTALGLISPSLREAVTVGSANGMLWSLHTPFFTHLLCHTLS